jgi:uncharacterized protein (TIGR02145 family)
MKGVNKILFLLTFNFVIINLNAQTGLNFQGVARTSNNVILASQAITIKLSILQGSSTGTADYVETRRVITNAQGLFTAVIGDTGAISTLGNFTTINWKLSPKFLKIEMDAAAGTNFITMGTTQFQYVAYAQFAKSVDAENIVGIVPVTLGGTGVASLAGLKTALVLNNVNNTADLTKPISTPTQTALDLKLNAADTSKYTKQTYTDSALSTKLSTAGTASTATKLATARNINGVAFDGSGDITVTADAGTLTGTTLKSTITGSSLTSVGTLANLTVTNAIAGSITGNATTATTAGTASTATKLATARNINGVAFDGSGDITISASADAGTLTGTTLKSTVTSSSLTSVGTLTNTTVNGKLVVGALTAASSSAILEASSTTQGFLPPRMTSIQRDNITSPAQGLLIYCTNCDTNGSIQVYNGTSWSSLSNTSSIIYYSNSDSSSVVNIGTQTWTTKNLDVNVYQDGTQIPQAKTKAQWISAAVAKTGIYCYYNFDSVNYAKIYGKLYNGYAVLGINTTESTPPTSIQIAARKKIAPSGFHLPSDDEWKVLISSLGDSTVAGGKMKETGTQHWYATNNASNSSGFGALPGGFVLNTKDTGFFDMYGMGVYGIWWSSSLENQSIINSGRMIINNYTSIFRPLILDDYVLNNGYSIRLIRNTSYIQY